MALLNATITTTASAIYTSVNNTAITTIIVCNVTPFNPGLPDDGLTYLTLYAVPQSGAIGNSTMIVNELPIPAGETVSFDQEKMVLANGDRIVAKSKIGFPATLTATMSILTV